MNKEKISDQQLWFILFIMRSVIIVSFLPVLTSADAFQDAWISGIIVLFGSEVFVILLALLDIKFPEMTVIEYSEKLLGKWLGKALGLVFLWLFLELSVIEVRLYGELIATSFMPRTPLIFIIASMIFISVACVYNGIEILGRMAEFLMFIFVIMIISLILIPLSEFDYKNLQPVFARGWRPVLNGALTPVALISQVWTLGMISVNVEKKKKLWIPVTSIGASLIVLIILAAITVAVIGPYEGARSTFPMLTLLRSVELSDFLQRTEAIAAFGWGLGLFITITTYLYSGVRGLAQWLHLDEYRALALPMGVIWIYMAVYSFDDLFEIYKFLSPEIFVPYGMTILFLPLVLLWAGYFYRKYRGEINKINEEKCKKEKE